MSFMASDDRGGFFPPVIPTSFPVRKWKTNAPEVAPNCPRCASTNTKFCYYNNYSLSQPRYFCKGCRRYWTIGGSLRNVPVGGGCRKSRRSKSSTSSAAAARLKQARNGHSQSPETDKSDESADFDLAAVFAKFLNQEDPGLNQSEISGQEISCSSNPEIGSEYPISRFQESELVSEFPQMEERENVGVEERSDALELQSLVVNENAGNGIWCDAADLQNLNFNWEPHDLDGIASDDIMKVSANLMDGDWGSFDLSTFELFSRPYV